MGVSSATLSPWPYLLTYLLWPYLLWHYLPLQASVTSATLTLPELDDLVDQFEADVQADPALTATLTPTPYRQPQSYRLATLLVLHDVSHVHPMSMSMCIPCASHVRPVRAGGHAPGARLGPLQLRPVQARAHRRHEGPRSRAPRHHHTLYRCSRCRYGGCLELA
jgi:hypothetical protein